MIYRLIQTKQLAIDNHILSAGKLRVEARPELQ